MDEKERKVQESARSKARDLAETILSQLLDNTVYRLCSDPKELDRQTLERQTMLQLAWNIGESKRCLELFLRGRVRIVRLFEIHVTLERWADALEKVLDVEGLKNGRTTCDGRAWVQAFSSDNLRKLSRILRNASEAFLRAATDDPL